MQPRPSMDVAVLVERRKAPSRWEQWGFRIADVLIDDGRFGAVPRVLRDDGRSALFLHPGLCVTLFRDEAEGYYLNLTSGGPVWFVMWRVGRAHPARPGAAVCNAAVHQTGGPPGSPASAG